MDPVTMVAAAVAVGAAAGAKDVATKAVSDAYSALKGLITRRYGIVEAEVVGVENEPDEPLRRQLLARQLTKAGADGDEQLHAAAADLLREVSDHAPAAAAVAGVVLTRVQATGEIEITDITAAGGSGVVATDVVAGGSIRIRGVTTGAQEPPHPPRARR
ncbi:hypothetical protein [Nocardia sp. NPDC050412]|uniref:hypothetical protein n=1 Tax=Nocardia sp. NPDC050412 TaxID=3364320 RepID=UPI0037A0750C